MSNRSDEALQKARALWGPRGWAWTAAHRRGAVYPGTGCDDDPSSTVSHFRVGMRVPGRKRNALFGASYESWDAAFAAALESPAGSANRIDLHLTVAASDAESTPPPAQQVAVVGVVGCPACGDQTAFDPFKQGPGTTVIHECKAKPRGRHDGSCGGPVNCTICAQGDEGPPHA